MRPIPSFVVSLAITSALADPGRGRGKGWNHHNNDLTARSKAGTFTGFISGTHPPEALIAAFDRAGVECGMMSTLDTYDMSGANDWTRAACAAHAGRLLGYIYLNPTRARRRSPSWNAAPSSTASAASSCTR